MRAAEFLELKSIGGIKTARDMRLADRWHGSPKEKLESFLLALGRTHLAASFFARFFVVLALFEDLENSLALHFLFQALEGFIQRLVFADLNSCHSSFL